MAETEAASLAPELDPLQRAEHRHHHAVVDRREKTIVDVCAVERIATEPAFKERIPIRIEEATAVGRKIQPVIVTDPAVDQPESCEQTRPRAEPIEQNISIGFSFELIKQRRNRIVSIVGFVAEQQEFSFLSGEQEHEPHHHRHGTAVNLRGCVAKELAVPLPVGVAERADKKLDRAAHLTPEGGRNVIAALGTLSKQCLECFGLVHTEETLRAECRNKKIECLPFVEPKLGIPSSGRDRIVKRRMNKSPRAAIRNQTKRCLHCPAQLNHPSNR